MSFVESLAVGLYTALDKPTSKAGQMLSDALFGISVFFWVICLCIFLIGYTKSRPPANPAGRDSFVTAQSITQSVAGNGSIKAE